jgi:hypothetical protein
LATAGTEASGIDDAGDIVGFYTTTSGQTLKRPAWCRAFSIQRYRKS